MQKISIVPFRSILTGAFIVAAVLAAHANLNANNLTPIIISPASADTIPKKQPATNKKYQTPTKSGGMRQRTPGWNGGKDTLMPNQQGETLPGRTDSTTRPGIPPVPGVPPVPAQPVGPTAPGTPGYPNNPTTPGIPAKPNGPGTLPAPTKTPATPVKPVNQ